MTIQDIADQMGIELLVFAACMYFGIKLIVTRDVRILKKDNPESIKHPREYTLYGGIAILFLGVAALVAGIVSFFYPSKVIVILVGSVIVMGLMWKFIHENYAE